MKTFIFFSSLLALALIVYACRIEPSSLKGDVTSVDVALVFDGTKGQVALPTTSFGGSGFTFAVDVVTKTGSGCIYSVGTPGTSDFVEVRLVTDMFQITIGDQVASTYRVVQRNKWQNLVMSVDYTTTPPTVSSFINGVPHPTDNKITRAIPVAKRAGFIGFCPSDNTRFNGVVDNVIIFNSAKTEDDAKWFTTQFFPLVSSDNLVAYFPFNDVAIGASSGLTKSLAGSSAETFIQGELIDGPVGSLAAVTDPASVADQNCHFSGVSFDGQTGAAAIPTFITQGGASQIVGCADGENTGFTVNAHWVPERGIQQMTIKTSNYHYWRITSPGLQVEHRTWGGWAILPRGADLIDYDETTYKFTDDMIVIQAGNNGFVKITESNGRMAYELGVNTAHCPLVGAPARQSWCDHLPIAEHVFDFSTEPVPEMPFGHKSTEPGVAGTPPVLACPPPNMQYSPNFCIQRMSQWTEWTKCPVDFCGTGTQTRNRSGPCGGQTDSRTCVAPCPPPPVHCTFNAWGEWTTCTAECGGGKHSRTRTTNPEKWGGNPCVGPLSQTDDCNIHNCPIPEVPPKPTGYIDPCLPYKNGDAVQQALHAQFMTACGARFTNPSAQFDKCMIDSCVTGTIPDDKVDCSTQRLKAATVPGFIIDPRCLSTCPNECGGYGRCVNNKCQCDAGWTGLDCSIKVDYPCFQTSAPGGLVSTRPLILHDANNNPIAASVAAFTTEVQATFRQYQVEDSLVLYLVQTSETNGQIQYHLAITGNNGNGNEAGGSVTVTITGAGSSTAQTWVENGATVAASVNGGNHVLTFTWPFNGRASALIKNLPDPFTSTVTFSGKTGAVNQILVGSTFGSNAASRVLSVYKYTKDQLEITGGTCQNECDAIRNCADCSANAKCGWCVETDRCMPGDRSGPTYYGQCANWRYTFDADISRRLTQEYAFPVTPGFTDVYLTSVDSANNVDLPLEVMVNVEQPEKIVWDVMYLNSWSAPHKGTWEQLIAEMLSVLRTFPNLGVGMNKLSAHARGFEVIKPLSNPRDLYWFTKQIESTAAEDLPQLPIHQALIEISAASANLVNWRPGARKVLIVTVDKAHATIPNVAAVRDALFGRDIIPVFLATPAVAPVYRDLVRQLGFGFVDTLSARSSNIRQASVRAISLAAGHAATFYAKSGHLDAASWTEHAESFSIYGLNRQFTARFSIPVHREQGKPEIDDTVLHMPAFGTARIENVKSDRPTAQASPTRSTGLEGDFQFIELQGRSFRNLYATTPVITVFPTRGLLYQVKTEVDANGVPKLVATDEIRAGAPLVTDSLGRVAWRGADGEHGANFDKFTFEVTDGCVHSAPVEVVIDVTNRNDPIKANILPPTGKEDAPQVLFLGAFDTDNDAFESIVTMSVHGLAEDGSMIMNAQQGELYQYNDAVLLSRENAASVGEKIVGENVLVKDAAHRVIFWPKDHTNSYEDVGKTPELVAKPCVNYKVRETATAEKYESAEKKVPIDIRAENDAPLIWGDNSADTPTYTYQWPAVSPNVGCWRADVPCVFDEDFGAEFPWDAPYEYISLGGGDVEKSVLTIVFTTVDCPADATLTNDLIGGRMIEVGDEVIDNVPNELQPVLKFRPGPDGNNQNAGTDGSYYCKIGYKLRDEDKLSAKEHLITISVNPRDDTPRLDELDTLVTVTEATPYIFKVKGVDPEAVDFDAVVVGCRDKGELKICVDASCTQTQTIDCANLGAGVVIPGQQIDTNTAANKGGHFFYNFIFTSDVIHSLSEGLQYNQVDIVFRAKDGTTLGYKFHVTINVVSLNTPPALAVNNITDSTITAAVGGERFAGKIVVTDADVGFGDMDVTITLYRSNNGQGPAGTMFVDTSAFEPSQVLEYNEGSKIALRGKIDQLNAALATFSLVGQKFAKYDVLIHVNDNGYFGQCGDPTAALTYTGELCPLETLTTVHVEFVDQELVNIAVISGAGVGVLALAVAGAVLATRYFNQNAADQGYAPWDEFQADGAVVGNPLYEASGIEGSNTLYQAGSGNNYQQMNDSYL